MNPNQFRELARDAAAYRAAIGGEAETIAWGTVFGLGVMLENAALAAERKTLEDPLWPRLEDPAKAAIGSLLTLHGPMVLSTKEGRELMEQADEMLLSREGWNALKADEQLVAGDLAKTTQIIDPAAATVVDQATGVMAEGAHPERGTAYGHATFKHAATIFIPAAALATFGAAGAFVGGEVGGVVGGAVGGLAGGAIGNAGSLMRQKRSGCGCGGESPRCRFRARASAGTSGDGCKTSKACAVPPVCRREHRAITPYRRELDADAVDALVYRFHRPDERRGLIPPLSHAGEEGLAPQGR